MPKTFHEIPRQRPATPLLDRIDSPVQLRQLGDAELEAVADELRAFLLWTVGQTGGHFGAGLGVIELTVALHYVFNTPEDRLVWDVGHQAYPHKILTGRREGMASLRQKDGLAAFPRRSESEYDTFGVGHSSTSIGAALGMAIAAQLQGIERKSVAVIGDGALTAGMAFEALNHASDTGANMLVVLNDNDMSISRNVGGLSNYLARLLSSRTYQHLRENGKKALSKLPGAWEIARRTEEAAKGMLVPGTLFEELGWNYIGPIDGHDLPTLVTTLSNLRDAKGPQFLHVITRKGKGLSIAEADPIGYHAITKLEPLDAKPKRPGAPKYSNIFGDWLCDMAAADPKLVGITPAMKEGSDLIRFAECYPERYFDVAIAEQHAVTLAAGLACDGMKTGGGHLFHLPATRLRSVDPRRGGAESRCALRHRPRRSGGRRRPDPRRQLRPGLPALHPRHGHHGAQRRERAAPPAHHRLSPPGPGRGALSPWQRPQRRPGSGPGAPAHRPGRGSSPERPEERHQGRLPGLRCATGRSSAGRRAPGRQRRRHEIRQTPGRGADPPVCRRSRPAGHRRGEQRHGRRRQCGQRIPASQRPGLAGAKPGPAGQLHRTRQAHRDARRVRSGCGRDRARGARTSGNPGSGPTHRLAAPGRRRLGLTGAPLIRRCQRLVKPL
ncbi:transketolase N-terminal domain/subunit [Pseudomonas psychrotolerans]|nr:transketolase N-terminal domain/subunit [Pseudomonas psychrotolerans]